MRFEDRVSIGVAITAESLEPGDATVVLRLVSGGKAVRLEGDLSYVYQGLKLALGRIEDVASHAVATKNLSPAWGFHDGDVENTGVIPGEDYAILPKPTKKKGKKK